jgi:hypothetical protein
MGVKLLSLSIDDLLLENESDDKVNEQIELIQQSHGNVFPQNYALTWVLANQVVQRFYGRGGIDAIPVWRDNFGWSQFNLTKASNCQQPPQTALETQRYILFDAIAVNWRKSELGGTPHFDVHNAIMVQKQATTKAIKAAINHLDLTDRTGFDHSACIHVMHQHAYCKLFQVVTDLICRAPEMVGRRELNIDLNNFGQVREEPTHHLRKLGLAQPGIAYDWFELFHTPTNIHLYININTGDLVFTNSYEDARALEYPGWNERSEEQILLYFAQMLKVKI